MNRTYATAGDIARCIARNSHVVARTPGNKPRKLWVVADFDPGRNHLYAHDDPTIVIRYAGFDEDKAEQVRREEGGQLIETEEG